MTTELSKLHGHHTTHQFGLLEKTRLTRQQADKLVIDYRKLNSLTIPDICPIPDINGILSQLKDSKYIAVLDLKSGFHQFRLKKSNFEKRHFRFTRRQVEDVQNEEEQNNHRIINRAK